MKRSFCTCALFISSVVVGCAFEDEKPSNPAATTGTGMSPSAGSGGNGGASTSGSGGAPSSGSSGSSATGGSTATSTSTGGSAGTGGGTGGARDAGRDGCVGAPAPADAGGLEPMLLSQTGLYANIACGELASDVVAYEPQFPLWSDTATKRRWIKLPAGTKINTDEMNFWDYPADTKMFKEFTRDGVRVETRMIWKHSPGDFFMMAYKWNVEQTEAVAVPNGEMNALGTQHDVPGQDGCTTCHSSMKDRFLGFTAIQLSHDKPGMNLMQAAAKGWFTTPPAANFVVPGDAVEKAALGYLHANCGICHNDRSKVFMVKADIDVWLDPTKLATVQGTATYTSLVNKDVTAAISRVTLPDGGVPGKRLLPGDPQRSAIHELMALRGDAMRQMPPTGTEMVDTTGLAAIDAWINKLKPSTDGGRD